MGILTWKKSPTNFSGVSTAIFLENRWKSEIYYVPLQTNNDGSASQSEEKRRQRHNPGAQYEATRNSGLLAVWIMGL